MPPTQQPKSMRGGGKQSSPLASSDKDEIADFKERLRQQEPNQKQKTSNRKGISEREVLLKEAQQLLDEDSILISPSRSLLEAIEKDLEEAGFSDGSDDEEEPVFKRSNKVEAVETTKKTPKPVAVKDSPPQKTRPPPQTKSVTPKSIKIAPQPDHNPLELDRQRLVSDRLEDVSSQISKIEKAISIFDQKEREIKNQKREECEKEKIIIKEKQTSLENMYLKIDTLQKKQDKELKILTREKKKLKDLIIQNEQKKNNLIKERDSLLSIPTDLRRNPVDDKLIQKRDQLIEVNATIERIASKISDIDCYLKELENDESEWLAQISTNSMILEGSTLTDDQKKNLTTLIRREKEIYLRTERLREKFPLEIFLIDLKFEYNRAVDELNSKKVYAESKRQEVCELIDEKRIILEELEQENLSAKQEYVSKKESGIENLQNELRKLSALENYVHTMSIEIEETEAILAHALELSSEELDFQQLRQCVDSFNANFLGEAIEFDQIGFKLPYESIVNTFKKLYINQSKSFIDIERKRSKEREEYISMIRDKLEKDKKLVEVAKEKISSSSIGEVERENSERKRGELERLGHFSNIVSELEQQIGGLIRDRQECDEEIESIVSQLNEIEESYNKEKEEVEKQVADKIENCTDDEMKLTEERFVRCEALVGSYYQIKDVIQRIVDTSKCDKVSQYVDASNNVESQVKVINKQKIEKQDELEKANEEIDSMINQKENLEREIESLANQEKQFESEITKEKVSIETRVQEIDNLLAIIEEDVKETIADYDSVTKPLEKSISVIEKELNNLTNSTMTLKKQLAAMKKNLEDIEASYTGKISQVRAQRQHLRHRLELKLQAVENVKNSGADIIMRSIKPSKNEKSNPPPVSKSGYYSMYMRNKDPNSLEDFDEDFYTDLAERENEGHENDDHTLENSNNSLEGSEEEQYENEPEITKDQTPVTTETTQKAPQTTTPKKPTNTSTNTTVANPSNGGVVGVASSNISRLLASKQYKLFGPNSKPLSKEDVQFVLDKFQFMCNGTLLHKKKSNTEYVLRHVCLSQEFTRILIRDNKKKVPESFLKVEHIDKVSKSKESTNKNLEGGFSLIIITDKKKMEFVTFDERDYNNWVDGLGLLIENKQNLFSLKYNIRDLLTNVQ
ncbi:predicted protein [Naegleria gruberi]|uniref:Predicted protein n=1 Tax=Naegleria gruberi TaxID=5762 RepID=D2V9X7_NAEGR|nr:uncharacterized protein NAEGRDRAFT_47833 [Naegleria gruberi]EFC46327.1 predicted protein [Naegleria gruberi]|eukprot:XP_002679071.1 predicted protein [Naegleria gruberi strain NEG-M]